MNKKHVKLKREAVNGCYYEKDICYVIEIYTDEEKTLQQNIMYKYGDTREAEYLRGQLNPHLTVLVATRYLDNEMKILKEEK